MRNTRMFVFCVHKDVAADRRVARPEQIEQHTGRMLHDDGVTLLKTQIGQGDEAKIFVKSDGALFVADPDTDVIGFFYG
jgi:hypothetical protein